MAPLPPRRALQVTQVAPQAPVPPEAKLEEKKVPPPLVPPEVKKEPGVSPPPPAPLSAETKREKTPKELWEERKARGEIPPSTPKPLPREEEPQPAGEWTSLFNGRDLTGCFSDEGRAGWKVEDGMLVARGPGGFNLWSDGSYGDCVLEF